MQKFKQSDELEQKVVNIFQPLLDQLYNERESFYNGAYESYPLGDVLFNLKRSPLTDAISREVFRRSFFAIFNLFTRPGTFEFYMEVFKTIFGDDVNIEFDVPSPGVLHINVNILNQEVMIFAAREIVNGAYEYSEIVDHEGDFIAFQIPQGVKTQSELDAIMNEIKPQGIFVVAQLNL